MQRSVHPTGKNGRCVDGVAAVRVTCLRWFFFISLLVRRFHHDAAHYWNVQIHAAVGGAAPTTVFSTGDGYGSIDYDKDTTVTDDETCTAYFQLQKCAVVTDLVAKCKFQNPNCHENAGLRGLEVSAPSGSLL